MLKRAVRSKLVTGARSAVKNQADIGDAMLIIASFSRQEIKEGGFTNRRSLEQTLNSLGSRDSLRQALRRYDARVVFVVRWTDKRFVVAVRRHESSRRQVQSKPRLREVLAYAAERRHQLL